MKRTKRWLLVGLCMLSLFGTLSGACAGVLDDDGVLRLVNRDTKITKNYTPENMVQPNVPTNKKSQIDQIYMRDFAAAALEELFAAAKDEQGYNLLAVSGYRSFGVQQLLFNQKVEAVGSVTTAQRTVAPAGASEHQLGLAMDIVCDTFRNLNRAFLETPEGQWVAGNCARFGFIVRYKAGWTDVTGYSAEPWHVRYVGVSHATAIMRLDIPYETYYTAISQFPEFVLTDADAEVLYGLAFATLAGDTCYQEELQELVSPEAEALALQELSLFFTSQGEAQ